MVYEVPTEQANRPALAAGRHRAHYLAVYGRHRPAETVVRTAVNRHLLARRRSPARRAVQAGSRRRVAPGSVSVSKGDALAILGLLDRDRLGWGADPAPEVERDRDEQARVLPVVGAVAREGVQHPELAEGHPEQGQQG